jgi:membrane peptidoglycan carboxypeptidase
VFTSKPTVINLGDKLWSVHNYEGSYLGPIDVQEATIHSDNSVYAQLTAQVGPKNVATMAHRLGVTRPLDDYFAIGLGVEAVSPLEMARAFSTLANGGERVDGSVLGNTPRAVLRVEQGNRADSNDAVEKPVIDSNDAAIVTSILQRVVNEGTGQRAALDDRPVAGKTGTTENYGDAWFVGYTPQLAVAVWVGHPDRLVPMETEFEGDPVAGGTLPALIWHSFARRALAHLDEPPESFPYPSYQQAVPLQVVNRNNKTLLDNGNCDGSRQVLYFVGSEPDGTAACKRNEVDVPNVVGFRLDDAKAQLYSMPLTAKVVWRRARPGTRLGRVIDQKPKGGTLSSWSTVRIVLPRAANGRVPDVVGMTVERARRKLTRRQLAGLVQTYVQGMPTGVVVAQFPHAGRAATRNMTVRLVVSRG